jgi:DNA gyrase subunit B
LSGPGLQTLVENYRSTMNRVHRLARVYPEFVLTQMIDAPSLDVADLQNREKVATWVTQLESLVVLAASDTTQVRMRIEEDHERELFLPAAEVIAHGVPTEYVFGMDFFKSGDYRALRALGEQLDGLLEEGAYIARGEKQQPVKRFVDALNWMMAEARKGISVQRYKGLGEMNPEQLWDTTMNPETRRMLRVTIEDAVAADMMFNTLMGDEVEPRRHFIEANALSVSNLDV